MRRTLMLAPETPAPPSSGVRLRMFHLARAIARVSDLTVGALGALEARSDWETTMVGRRNRLEALARSGRRPYMESLLWSNDLARLATTGRFDLIQVESPFLLRAAAGARVPIVLDAHNVEADVARTLAVSDPRALHRARWRWETRKVERLESWAFGRAAAVAATSDADAARIVAAGAREVVVVPNGVDVDAIAYQPPAAEPVLIFVGHFGYRPNQLAAVELVEEILPRVRRMLPEARLLLAGRSAPIELAGDAVEVISDPIEIPPLLRRAGVCVIPLRAGSGTRLKALEVFAAGVPVVSTPLGIAGLDARAGKHAIVAETQAELAEATLMLLNDPVRRLELSVNARELVETQYDWKRVAVPLLELHERLVAA
jgi:glycosyltransferase involved in cell wall biosynthesis